MKHLLILLLPILCSAQTLSVKFHGAGNTNGLPAYWPAYTQLGNLGAGWTVMDKATLENIISTNQAAYNSWESNKTYAARAALDANIQKLLDLYSLIPTARSNLTAAATATNTLTTTQLTAQFRQACLYQEKTLELLQRLGPVLKSMYGPEDDQTP